MIMVLLVASSVCSSGSCVQGKTAALWRPLSPTRARAGLLAAFGNNLFESSFSFPSSSSSSISFSHPFHSPTWLCRGTGKWDHTRGMGEHCPPNRSWSQQFDVTSFFFSVDLEKKSFMCYMMIVWINALEGQRKSSYFTGETEQKNPLS